MTSQESTTDICLPGTLLVLSAGASDDYHHFGVFLVRRACDQTVLRAFLDAPPSASASPHYHAKAFLTRLLAEGYIERLPYTEIYLGDFQDPRFTVRQRQPAPVAARRTLLVARRVEEEDRILLYGTDPDFYVIASSTLTATIQPGVTIAYEPYGMNFGWYLSEAT